MRNSGDLYDFPDALENQVSKFVGADESGNLISVNVAYYAPGAQGRVALAQGGIAASYNDLEKYSHALAAMITGQESHLTADLEPRVKEDLKKIYRGAINDGYSLGVKIRPQDNGDLIIRHVGAFPCNRNEMRVIVKANGEVTTQNFLSKQDGLISAIIQRPEDLL
jgi:hypothetical protein